MNKLKKLIALGTTVSMLLSLVVVLPVSAVTIADGDLVKTADSSAVYYIQGANKRVFPHSNVYHSWGYAADYSAVKTVSSSELAAYTDANAMPFRDGALFRGTAASLGDKDATAVFYVENAVLRPVLSEQVYQGLFSDTSWSKVTWVPDDLLTKFNYDMGENLTTSATHPDGVVFIYSGLVQKYVIEDGKKRAISDAAFTANRYREVDVLTLDTTETYANGTSVTGVESGLLTPGWLGVTAEAGALTASLVSIAGATFPQQAENISVLSVRFTAGSSAATVTGLTFKRLDMGETDDWDNFYLYEGDTLITPSGRGLSSDEHEVEFPTISVSVSANSSKVITLRGDGSSSISGGELHSFRLKGVETTATVSGLPLTGNVFTVGQVTVGALTVAAGPVPANPSVGATGVEIATLKLTVGDNDVEFSQMVLTFSGSLSTSAVTNLKLYRESTLLASVASIESDDTATFTLASPYTIAESQQRSFSIKADVGGKVGETLTTKVEETNHLFAIDKTYSFGANVTGPSVSLAAITLQGGELTLTDNGPATGDITKNVQDITLLEFAITADRQVEVKRLEVALYGDAEIGSGLITDLKIKDADTGATLMSKALTTSSCISGGDPTDCVIDEDNGTRTAGVWDAQGQNNRWQLTDSFYLSTNVTRNLKVTVDIGTSTDNESDTISATVSEVYYDSDQSYMKDVSTGDYLFTEDIVPDSLAGNTQTIVASSLTLAEASTPVSALTVVKGALKVDGIGVVLRAGDGSAIKVTQFPIRVYVDDNGAGTAATFSAADEDTTPRGEVIAVYLYDDSTGNLLGTKTLTNTTAAYDYGLATFDSLDINVAAGSTKKLVVKFDVSSESEVRYVAVGVVAADVTAYDIDDTSVDATGDVNLVADASTPNYTHISAEGTLTVAQDSSTPDSNIVLAGTEDVVFSKVKFTAEDEEWTIEELRIDLATSDNEGSVETVKISYDSGNTTYTKSSALAGGYADFSAMGWVIPKDTEAILTISADLAEINAGIATTGRTLQLGVSSTAATFKANGESGAQDVIAAASDVNGEAMYLRKSRPTVAGLALPTTTLINGTNVINKFNITADSAGEVDLKKLSWNITVSDASGNELDFTTWKLYKGTSNTAIAGVWANALVTSTAGAVPMDETLTGTDSALEFEPTSEISIPAGETVLFTLKAVASDVVKDDGSISASLMVDTDTDGTTDNLTGYLADHDTELIKLEITDTTEYTVDFLWTDRARGVNHTATPWTSGTKYEDWTNGYLIDILPTTTYSLYY